MRDSSTHAPNAGPPCWRTRYCTGCVHRVAGYYIRGVGHHRYYGSLKPEIGQEILTSRLHMAAEGAQVQQQNLEVKWRTCNLLQLFRLALHRRLEQRRVCHLSNRADRRSSTLTHQLRQARALYHGVPPSTIQPQGGPTKAPAVVLMQQGGLARRHLAGSLERHCRFEPWRGRWPAPAEHDAAVPMVPRS
jgi:hypothetical protein